jgi:cobalamin biosynthesis protein CbiG
MISPFLTDTGKVSSVTESMNSPVKGNLAFVVLNDQSEKKIKEALQKADWTGPLRDIEIVNISRERLKLSELCGNLFEEYGGLIFVMAMGIVIRVIAPHIRNKYDDPAVVVLDDKWRHAVSTLSGHEGGANWLCYQAAKLTGAQPVISTGTETNKSYTLGIGCRRGTKSEELKKAVEQFLKDQSLNLQNIRVAGTVDLKKSEEGITRAMEELKLPLVYFSGRQINEFDGEFTPSKAAQRQLKIKGVSEPCALLCGRSSRLVVPKTIIGRVTLALAEEQDE